MTALMCSRVFKPKIHPVKISQISVVEKFAAAYAADVNDLQHELPQSKRLLEQMFS